MTTLFINSEILKMPKKMTEDDKFWVFLQARYILGKQKKRNYGVAANATHC